MVALHTEGVRNKPSLVAVQCLLWSESSRFRAQWMPAARKAPSSTTGGFVWCLSWDTGT